MSETSDIVTPAIRALNGIPGVYAYRIFTGVAKVRGGAIHGAPLGCPDVGVVIRSRAVFFEAKETGKGASVGQADAHEYLRRAGAEVHVIYSVHEAIDVVREILSRKETG